LAAVHVTRQYMVTVAVPAGDRLLSGFGRIGWYVGELEATGHGLGVSLHVGGAGCEVLATLLLELLAARRNSHAFGHQLAVAGRVLECVDPTHESLARCARAFAGVDDVVCDGSADEDGWNSDEDDDRDPQRGEAPRPARGRRRGAVDHPATLD